MISKELLSEVLEVGIRSFEVSPNKNSIYYVGDNMSISNGVIINIYELAHKGKEWALTHNYSLETRPYNDYGNIDWHIAIWKDNIQLLPINLCNSEPDAIFKACQWILDNNIK